MLSTVVRVILEYKGLLSVEFSQPVKQPRGHLSIEDSL